VGGLGENKKPAEAVCVEDIAYRLTPA